MSTITNEPSAGPHGLDAGGTAAPTLRRLGIVFLISQLGWCIPNSAGSTLLQQLAAELAGDDKVLVYATASTIGAILASIVAVTFGTVSDRLHSRFGTRAPLIIGGAVVAVLSFASTGLVSDSVGLIFAAAIFQLGLGVMLGSVSALMPEYVARPALGRISAAMGIGVLLGQTLGGVAGGLLVTQARVGFVALPWTLLIGALLTVGMLRGMPRRGSSAPVDEVVRDAREGSGALAADGRPRPWWRVGDFGFWSIFAGRAIFILALYMGVQYMLYLLTDDLHLPPEAAGHIVSLATLVFAVTAMVTIVASGPLSDRLRRRKPFIVGGSLLVTVGSIPMLMDPSVAALVTFMLLSGAGFGAYIAVDQALMVEALPSAKNNARDLGILGAATTLPGVFAPAVAGLAVTTVGYSGLFAVVGALGVVAAACMLGVRRLR